ncbi:ATP-grasp domain-containing protein [Nonomuraea pusilla]|uniref:Biotin carboxylase n=1 Tax=Nonomuraea pusilla TaxID=46177 RepID=A0A1H8J4F3_9ACTN|nr:ATP-grasp domain-containing protein [Nonomuraea pusilla]SEN75539.1 Biotin carboxylase [Nonomuraea pusilla]
MTPRGGAALAVLGGADGAISTCQAASRLGVRTICVDLRADAPAVAHADEFLNVSTRDLPRLVRALAARGDLAGVVSPASDVNLPSQLAVARRLGLPCGLSDGAVRASTDKGHFRAVCDRLGLPGPRYVHGEPAHVLRAAPALTFPLMVKPVDSSGSRGVSLCPEPGDLPGAVELAREWSLSGMIVAEEYLEGGHYTAEAFVVGGAVALIGVSERELTPPPLFITVQHVMPGPPGLTEAVRGLLDRVCAEVGLREGPLNADLLVRPGGEIVLVEMGARLGGNGLAELLGLVHGVDVVEEYVRAAVGLPPRLTPSSSRHAAVRVLGAGREGKLVRVEGEDAVRALPGVVDLVLAASPGDHVERYTRAGAKLGYLTAAAPDRAALSRVLDEAARLLRFDIGEAP